MRKRYQIPWRLACLTLVVILSVGYVSSTWGKAQKSYGVFLNADASDLKKISAYQTIVIDAQLFSKKDIAYLKNKGCTVYSYLNIGSLENFRSYYDAYRKWTLGFYENWEEERWMNVSESAWQRFLISLEEQLLEKEIDGFFVDNCDVYYEYQTDAIYEGLSAILQHLMTYKKAVIINGGDTFVMKYQKRNGSLQDIMTGVNQECVWSKINFKTGKFQSQSKYDREYFRNYIETCDRMGLDVYLLEYTTQKSLKKKIVKYCKKRDFQYYIADSLELGV
ncbi:MAG: endo alpha-1,4 polygalactosaminidase [Lachnospiraceae bacterium]|nr:endo alpha-1,4 polygalactosaminidase [Lachnospiraceae bacterium]